MTSYTALPRYCVEVVTVHVSYGKKTRSFVWSGSPAVSRQTRGVRSLAGQNRFVVRFDIIEADAALDD